MPIQGHESVRTEITKKLGETDPDSYLFRQLRDDHKYDNPKSSSLPLLELAQLDPIFLGAG